MANDFVTVTRTLVKRGWSDFEPKVISGLLTGSVAAFAISVLSQYGVHLSPIQSNYLAIGCYFLGSYFTPSTGTTITKHDDKPNSVVESETHSGNAVSVITNSTPIQRPVAVPSPATDFMAARGYDIRPNSEAVAMGTDDNATKVFDH